MGFEAKSLKKKCPDLKFKKENQIYYWNQDLWGEFLPIKDFQRKNFNPVSPVHNILLLLHSCGSFKSLDLKKVAIKWNEILQ